MSLLLSTQFQRTCTLNVGSNSGNGIDLSRLRVTFIINRADTQTLANAIIRVYNPKPDTVKSIQKEYTKVTLQAGYGGMQALIFSGTVLKFRYGRENPTDTYLEIVAQDGDQGYNFATMGAHNGTGVLARGWKQNDLHSLITQALNPYGIDAGYTPDFAGPDMPRAKVCYGMARDYLRTLAESAGTSCQIADGKLNMIPLAGTLPGEAVEITVNSGLVGMPQQTLSGITVRCLLNPKVKHGGTIKLDNSTIQLGQFGTAVKDLNQFPDLDQNGLYKVYAITMRGDTRGQEWYSDIVCAGLNATAPVSSPYYNAVASSTGY